MADYNTLFVSPQWLQEYHTKYPHGLSILENIIEWVNQTNELIEYVNASPDYVKQVLGEMEADGRLKALIDDILLNDKISKGSFGLNVRDYGLTGDGVTDDTAALQALISAASTDDVLYFPKGRYIISQEILIDKTLKIEGLNAVIQFSESFDAGISNTLSCFYVTADDVEIEGFEFDGNNVTGQSGNNRMIWVDGSNVSIRNCVFRDLPGGGSNFNGAIGYSILSSQGNVVNCRFVNCPGGVFTKAPRTRILSCTSEAPKDVSFALNGSTCKGSSVIGCKVYADNITCSIHIGIEEGASESIIEGNYIYGVKDGIGIGFITVTYTTPVKGGIVKNNIIDGGSFDSTAPSALLSIGKYYTDMIVSGNRLVNTPGGNSNNTAALLSPDRMHFTDNIIESGIKGSFCLLISESAGERNALNVFNNIFRGRTGIQIIRIINDHASRVMNFKENTISDGLEGISYSTAANVFVHMENNIFETVTSKINSGTALMDYFNVNNADRYIHKISDSTTLYGSSAPVSGKWKQGDRIYNQYPSAGGYQGWICITGGTPGTWKGFGIIES